MMMIQQMLTVGVMAASISQESADVKLAIAPNRRGR